MNSGKACTLSKPGFGAPANAKYKLVRERDGLTKYGREMGWIEWGDDSRFKELHNKPQVGLSCILDPHRFSFTWCTTTVTEIIEQKENYIKFNTKNSVYELYENISE